MLIKYIFLFFIVSILCCNKPQESRVEYDAPKFVKTKVINDITPITNSEMLISRPYAMYVCDSLLVVSAHNIENRNVFHAISLNSGIIINSFATEGRGPNELLDYMRQSFDAEHNTISAIDNSGRGIVIDLVQAINGSGDFVKENFKMTSYPIGLTKHFFIDKILNLGAVATAFCITDRSGRDTLSVVKDFPPITEEAYIDSLAKSEYYNYSSLYAVKPDASAFVHTTCGGMITSIYKIDNNQIKLVTTRYFYEPKFDGGDADGGTINICASDEYIYLLYRDVPYDELMHFKLGVFDWNGREICCYEVPKSIRNFTYDKSQNRMICWAKNADGEEYLGYFDLK